VPCFATQGLVWDQITSIGWLGVVGCVCQGLGCEVVFEPKVGLRPNFFQRVPLKAAFCGLFWLARARAGVEGVCVCVKGWAVRFGLGRHLVVVCGVCVLGEPFVGLVFCV
jgi:hypothetical protein